MSIRQIKLLKTGGDPFVEIIFGHAQVGRYTIDLLDDLGNFKHQIGKGINTDKVKDKFPIGLPASALHDHFLSWTLEVMAPVSGPGQLYSASVVVSQDAEIVEFFAYTGELHKTEPIPDLAIFKVN